MPFLKIQSNVSIATDEADSFIRETAAEVADLLGKPESVMMGMLETERTMSFGGSNDPTAIAQVEGIELGPEKAEPICVFLCNKIEQKWGIPQNRVFVKFGNVPRGMWGGNGKIY